MKLTGCLKLVSGFYSLVAMAGGGTAGLGILSKVKSTSHIFEMLKNNDNSLGSILHVASNLLIGGGCFIFLMGLIGCFGALKRKSWVILVFFVAVLIIFIIQVAVAVMVLIPNSLKEKAFIHYIENTYKPNSQLIDIWDGAMKKFECCGYKGFDDFTNSAFVKEGFLYPAQCCDNMEPCEKEKAKEKKVRGCYDKLLEVLLPVSRHLAFLIGILEIIAMIVSLTVYRCLRRLPG